MGSTHIAPPHAVGQQICVVLQGCVNPQEASQISTDRVGGHEPFSDADTAVTTLENDIRAIVLINKYKN